MLAGSLSAQEPVTADLEERAAVLVRLVSSLESAATRIDVVLVRGEVRMDITNVTGVRSDGRMLIFDYEKEGAATPLRAVCDASDVLAILENPR